MKQGWVHGLHWGFRAKHHRINFPRELGTGHQGQLGREGCSCCAALSVVKLGQTQVLRGHVPSLSQLCWAHLRRTRAPATLK